MKRWPWILGALSLQLDVFCSWYITGTMPHSASFDAMYLGNTFGLVVSCVMFAIGFSLPKPK
jgi:hypothetical protein